MLTLAGRYRLDASVLARLAAFLAVAWLPAMIGLWLFARGAIAAEPAVVAAVAGALAAALIAGRRGIRRIEPGFRTPAGGPGSAWSERANPAGQYANRWASYQDLSRWLARHDWTGKRVAEFGRSNEVLRAFVAGARHEVLEYPEHDVQDLRAVAADLFDLVILDQTLEHVPDPERALREIHRVLRPAGVALVTTPFLVPIHATPEYGDYSRWTPDGLRILLNRCGFDVEVRMWGNRDAARILLDEMYLTVEDARKRGVPLESHDGDEKHPITIWAIARASK